MLTHVDFWSIVKVLSSGRNAQMPLEAWVKVRLERIIVASMQLFSHTPKWNYSLKPDVKEYARVSAADRLFCFVRPKDRRIGINISTNKLTEEGNVDFCEKDRRLRPRHVYVVYAGVARYPLPVKTAVRRDGRGYFVIHAYVHNLVRPTPRSQRLTPIFLHNRGCSKSDLSERGGFFLESESSKRARAALIVGFFSFPNYYYSQRRRW